MKHVPCVGHVLNLVVSDLFKSNENDKDAVKYVDELVAKCRKLVGSFRHSYKLSMRLLAKQKSLGMEFKTKLVQDVSTRWNSAFDMLDSIIKNYPALKSIVSDSELVTDSNNNRLLKKF
jgi:hypothetical protein